MFLCVWVVGMAKEGEEGYLYANEEVTMLTCQHLETKLDTCM